jgi:hypothetical protein
MPELIMLPPDAVWLTDEQAAQYLGYELRYFQENIRTKPWFTVEPSTALAGARRWRVSDLSDFLVAVGCVFIGCWSTP